MKKTFVKSVSRKFIPVLAITTLLLACTPVQSMANNKKTIEIISSGNTCAVQFSGSTDEALFFDVKANNPKGDKFTLIIQNDDGDVLFTKDYNDKDFSKRIKLLRDENSSRYNFSIRSANKDLETNFAISTVTRVVDDVIVTKL